MTSPPADERAERAAARPAPYVCWLRVLEPLAAFDDVQRARLLAAMAAGRTLDPLRACAAESQAALVAAARLEPVLPDPGVEAAVLTLDAITYACPMQTRWRAAVALEAFEDQVVDPSPYLPGSIVERAREVRSERGAYRPGVPHVLTATGLAPLHWFALVEPSERIIVLGRGRRTVVFRTPMSAARRRLARALAVVRRGMGDGGVADTLETLGRWLEEFHPRSLVELDLSGLARVMTDEAVRQDSTAQEVAEMVAALAAGDAPRVGELYERVTSRWRAVAGLAAAN